VCISFIFITLAAIINPISTKHKGKVAILYYREYKFIFPLQEDPRFSDGIAVTIKLIQVYLDPECTF
jgi:hypothetical protein